MRCSAWGGPAHTIHSAMQDNYVWILQESQSGKVAVVDPSEAEPVTRALEQRCVLKPGLFDSDACF